MGEGKDEIINDARLQMKELADKYNTKVNTELQTKGEQQNDHGE